MTVNEPIGYSIVSNGKATTLSILSDPPVTLAGSDPRFAPAKALLESFDTTEPAVQDRLSAILEGRLDDDFDPADAAEVIDLDERISAVPELGQVLIDGEQAEGASIQGLLAVLGSGTVEEVEALWFPIVRFIEAFDDAELREQAYAWIERGGALSTEGDLVGWTQLVAKGDGSYGIALSMSHDGALVIPVSAAPQDSTRPFNTVAVVVRPAAVRDASGDLLATSVQIVGSTPDGGLVEEIEGPDGAPRLVQVDPRGPKIDTNGIGIEFSQR